MNDEEKSYLELYLEELAAIKTYTEEEQKSLLKKAMDGDKQAKNEYINANLLRVTEIARLYVNQGVPLEAHK